MQARSVKARGSRAGRGRPGHGSGSTSRQFAEAEWLLLARKVRGARAVLGWTQAELGNRIGVTQAAIHRIEQGRGDLKHSTFTALQRLFTAEGVTFETTDRGFNIVVELPV